LPFGERASVQLHPLVSDSDSSDIWEAIEADPFRPDRTSATARYRLPGTVPDSEHLAEQHAPAVTLLGTVMSTDGSGFALCQTGDEPARLIRPGQSIGGLKLQRVEQAKALFKGADGRSVTLTVPQGGPP
jgi:hypothetical protein